jgi:hypothetical protein
MTLGLSERRYIRRRRGQFIVRLLRWIFVLVVAITAGYYAYNLGTDLALRESRLLESQLQQLRIVNQQLKTGITGLEAAIREERRLVAQWRDRYKSEVPKAEDIALLQNVKERIANGVSRKRLKKVIMLAQENDLCETATQTRRFVVQNPVYAGPNQTVTFSNKSIIVAAIGESKINSNGRPEAWFDPAKPITVYFTRPGRAATSTKGVLPLHHAVVIGDSEYRFNIVSGERSFARVTAHKCVYP